MQRTQSSSLKKHGTAKPASLMAGCPGSLSTSPACIVSYKVDLVGCVGGLLCSLALQWVLPRTPREGRNELWRCVSAPPAGSKAAWPGWPLLLEKLRPGSQSTWAALIEVLSLLSLLTLAWSQQVSDISFYCIPSCRSPPPCPNLCT